jgi:hypothetical protein
VATLLASVPLFYLATRQRVARAATTDGVIVVADESSNVVPLPLSDAPSPTAQRRTS